MDYEAKNYAQIINTLAKNSNVVAEPRPMKQQSALWDANNISPKKPSIAVSHAAIQSDLVLRVRGHALPFARALDGENGVEDQFNPTFTDNEFEVRNTAKRNPHWSRVGF